MSEKKASAHNLFNQGLSDYFWDKIQMEPNSGCWLWTASIDRDGYGNFGLNRIMKKAHRVSYEAHKGPIPDGLQIDHLCRVRCCVNPDHLEAVTCKENIKRGNTGKHERDKTHCAQGHEYNAENTYVRPNGWRQCRECSRQYDRDRSPRQKRKRQIALAEIDGIRQ